MKKFMSVKNVLLTLALVFFASLAFESVNAKAAVTYDPVADTVTSDANGYFYVLKKESGNKLSDTSESVTAVAGTPIKVVDDLGIKAAKPIYLYFSTTQIAEKKDSIAATTKILPVDVKKYTYAIDYYATGSGSAFISLKYDDSNKASHELYAKTGAHTAEAPADKADFSLDGTAWADATGFNGAVLAAKYGETVYVRAAGSATTRAGKTLKVKIGKQAEAKPIKIDYKNGTIAIKNGMEYRTAASQGAIETAAWKVILPYDKTKGGTAKEVATDDYYAVGKKSATATNRTKEKVKALPIAGTSDIVYQVRTAATDKKPASKASEVKVVVAKTAAPTVTGAAIGATGTAISAPTIANAEGDTATAKYEYYIVKAADAANVDEAATKWKTIASDKAKFFKEGGSFTYYNKSGQKVKVTLGKDNYKVFIRRAADKTAGVLASNAIILDLTWTTDCYTLSVHQE